MINGFLLGIIATASLTAGLFFLRFWKKSHDRLFLAFAAFFFIEVATRITLLGFERPNEGSPWIYLIRLAALIVLLAAIVAKNYERTSQVSAPIGALAARIPGSDRWRVSDTSGREVMVISSRLPSAWPPTPQYRRCNHTDVDVPTDSSSPTSPQPK